MKQPDKHAKYFEGILQLRNPSPELIKYVAKTIDKDIRKFLFNMMKLTSIFQYFIHLAVIYPLEYFH